MERAAIGVHDFDQWRQYADENRDHAVQRRNAGAFNNQRAGRREPLRGGTGTTDASADECRAASAASPVGTRCAVARVWTRSTACYQRPQAGETPAPLRRYGADESAPMQESG